MDFLSFFPQSLQNKVKIKYNLNRKIHTRSCVYTFVDNEGPKKNYSTKILDQKTVKTTVVVLSLKKNCKVFITQKYIHLLFRFN
jgi:hypothetical protein